MAAKKKADPRTPVKGECALARQQRILLVVRQEAMELLARTERQDALSACAICVALTNLQTAVCALQYAARANNECVSGRACAFDSSRWSMKPKTTARRK